MIDYEKKYWSENEFKLNGENYVGYVGIKDRNAYVFDTAEPLTKNSTFYTQFNCGDYFFDRILDESLILPFNKKEVQFYPNDFLNRGTIKSILQKLQVNNDFIYKCSTISDTLIPIVDDCLNFTSNKNGVLYPKKLSNAKNNTTSKDEYFYPQKENQTPDFNFDELIASDMCITNVDMDGNDKRVKLLIFLTFKTKLVIIRYNYYPENFQKNIDKNVGIDFKLVDD